MMQPIYVGHSEEVWLSSHCRVRSVDKASFSIGTSATLPIASSKVLTPVCSSMRDMVFRSQGRRITSVPIDAELTTAASLEFEMISPRCRASDHGASRANQHSLLDACRNNPLA